jgi:1-acyl-sn-glycerol-3-phosphate acyltransferase
MKARPNLGQRLLDFWTTLRELQRGSRGTARGDGSTLTPFARRFRASFRNLARWVEANLTRTTITGLENLPTQAPVIFAANHFSTYDAVLFMAHLPENTELVGPGDFKLLFPANILIPLAGIVRIKRAALDRDSLRLMSGALERGMNLALFPEGGTWEKRLEDVKPGAAYLSQQQNVPIVPISFGGTYNVWGKIIRLQRPRISIHFGEMLPPVVIEDRKRRAELLQAASLTLMQRIYEHLPPEDQARYDLMARQQFRADITYAPNRETTNADADFAVLAEVFSKPNLASPLWRNAKLPIVPLVKHGKFYPAAQFVVAAERLHTALTGEFSGYLNYRLGDDKAAQALDELTRLRELSLAAHHAGQAMRFGVGVKMLGNEANGM